MSLILIGKPSLKKLLVFIIFSSIFPTGTFVSGKSETVSVVQHDKEDNFCKLNEIAIKKPELRHCPGFENDSLWFFLSLFLIIAWGAFVRTVLRITKLSIPYTVILMITGLILGCGTHITSPDESVCSFWSKYTKIARIPPKIILYTFLPPLIFESAFNMKVHVFLRSLSQILVLALPGMIISVFLTGLICYGFMTTYHWSFSVSFMYGSIVSATDPVAVVAILKELGTSESLGMIIEGESLLNDGVAILMYEIFKKVVQKKPDIIIDVAVTLVKIAVGGPVFGYIVGKICSLSLSLIFNDAATEITITIFASYVVYWVGENLGISGVISVVVLGLTLSADSTSISPEVEKMVHHFWEMVGYLANTVLFVMVGIILSETAISQIGMTDWFNLMFLYVILNIIRLFMIGVLLPWLTRIGYGMNWKDMVVSTWGGLRGAVGLCLALEVYYEEDFCIVPGDTIGPKFLFHTAGIVFLTLFINGTTTKGLLKALRLTEVSTGRLQDMNNAVKVIIGAKERALLQYKQDRFLADADWSVVTTYTQIKDPYKEVKQKEKVASGKKKTLIGSMLKLIPNAQSNVGVGAPVHDIVEVVGDDDDLFNKGKDGDNLTNIGIGIGTSPTTAEFREEAEEARLRLLKALKVSFYRQYEQGVLSAHAVEVLINTADVTGDKELHMIHARDFQKYFKIHGFYHWFRVQFIQRFHLDRPSVLPPKPLQRWRHVFWKVATNDWFTFAITCVVILNMVPAIWEFVRGIKYSTPDTKYVYAFLITNIVFTSIYFLEFLIKMIGYGCREYWRDKWNWIDAVVLVVGVFDVSVTLAFVGSIIDSKTNNASSGIAIVTRTFRLVKICRSLRLFKCIMPALNKFLDSKINKKLFLGYDIGKGFVTAVDDVIKFLPQMAEHERVYRRLDYALKLERLETIRLLGILQQKHPNIAIAVKTWHASRAILNQMRDTLKELKEDGLVDENESEVLNHVLEKKMKELFSAPSTVAPNMPEIILSNILWLHGNPQLTAYIYDHATLLNFSEGDTICAIGDPPNGIYLIVKGMVKAHFIPSIPILKDRVKKGILPNSELFGDLTYRLEETDYLQVGYVIGEIGILTGAFCSAHLTCETNVSVYHISQHAMKHALKNFNETDDSLESRIWRSVGMRVASAVLSTQIEYSSWTHDKIRSHVEKSAVPIGEKFENMTVPEFICDVILLQGLLQDAHTSEIYIGPSYIPRSCRKIEKVLESSVDCRFLVVAIEEMEGLEEEDDNESVAASFKKSIQSLAEARQKSISSLGQQGTQMRRRSTAFSFGVKGKKRPAEEKK